MQIVVVGGGAAGFFSAITCASFYPQHQITILEKSPKLLSKVKISGGGRCNVTHACYQINPLARHYPRGEKFLKKSFHHFMPQDMIAWLESKGVKLKVEADGRIFPITDDSQTIIDCFLRECKRLNIEIKTISEVKELKRLTNGGFQILLQNQKNIHADRLIWATGGSPKLSGFETLQKLGHTIIPPVPSLFTFNIPQNPLTALMGVSVEKVNVRIQGHKLQQKGAVLVTHWGLSGPAILKLSAWGARLVHDLNYNFTLQINWLNDTNEDTLRNLFEQNKTSIPKKKIVNVPHTLPKRLWEFLVEKAKIAEEKTWIELSKTEMNRLIVLLTQDTYHIKGKTTFKEEFVTCGGVDLSEVSPEKLQSRLIPELFFAGEVLDLDGITGGFNFQAAWTTGYLAGKFGGLEN